MVHNLIALAVLNIYFYKDQFLNLKFLHFISIILCFLLIYFLNQLVSFFPPYLIALFHIDAGLWLQFNIIIFIK